MSADGLSAPNTKRGKLQRIVLKAYARARALRRTS